MKVLKKITSLIVKYRKTAAVVAVGVAGASEAFGLTGVSESLSGLFNAVCGTPAP